MKIKSNQGRFPFIPMTSSTQIQQQNPFQLPKRSQLGLWIGSLCLFLSMVCFRILLVRNFQIALPNAYRQGLLSGVISDFALTVLVFALGLIASGLLPRLRNPVQVLGWLTVYILTLSNACYLLFFMQPLDWSAVHNNKSNLWAIRGTVKLFLVYPFIQISLALFVLGVFSKIRSTRRIEQLAPHTFKRALQRITLGALLIVLAGVINQSVVWFRIPRILESPLSQNVAIRWWKAWIRNEGSAENHPLSQQEFMQARKVMKQFSQMEGNTPPLTASTQGHSEETSLDHTLRFDPAHTRQLRASFGLPLTGKINVVLIFMESARAFEFLEPHLGPEAYPNLRRIMASKGLFFSQAYTSAKYTVEGQFTTLCSNLDRMEGPTVYSSIPFLKTVCLPDLFVKNGYDTYWMNPFFKEFSGKYVFESNHGTQYFLDGTFFKDPPDVESANKTEWGVSDDVFLSQALKKLNKLHETGKPFFAHLLTTGTHVPWREFPNFQLSEKLSELTEKAPNHHAYLSSVKALDSALGHFLDDFFKSPLANDTIVFLVSDHGNGIYPAYPVLHNWQKRLIWPRILVGAVSRDRRSPEKIPYPINQLDIAPLIASVTGLQGTVGWLGRDPTLGSGTPWVSRINHRISFRNKNQLCIYSTSQEKTICQSAPPEVDPLLDLSLPEKTEDPQLSQFMKEVVESNESLLNSGRLTD